MSHAVSLTLGSEVPLTVVDLSSDGRAVAKAGSHVVFLDQGVPGDEVLARVVSLQKKAAVAEVTALRTPSPYRRLPMCPHFSACGGCSFLDTAYDRLLQWKEEHIRRTLRIMAGGPNRRHGDIPVLPILPSPLRQGCRNKMTFAFAQTPTGPIVGLRARGAHTVVEVRDCRMQSPAVADILEHTGKRIKELGLSAWEESGGYTNRACKGDSAQRQRCRHGARPRRLDGYLRFLIVHTPFLYSEGRRQIVVECITAPAQHSASEPPDGSVTGTPAEAAVGTLGRELMRDCGVTGFVHSERRSRANVAQGERILQTLGRTEYEETFNRLTLTAPHNAFLQTNTGAASLLYAEIERLAALTGKETVWDVYCGIGSIGLFIAPAAAALYGFDIQKEAVAAAEKNAERSGVAHCRFFSGPLEQTLRRDIPKPDVVVIDPPRAGMTPATAKIIAELPAERLIYVSCDVATQARDIARLSPRWTPVQARPVDMFPFTPHTENIVLLE